MAFKTKAQLTEVLVAEAVGAGKKAYLESVDFSDPNRSLTCLEFDFPILPINQIAQIEGNAGKPIYQMSKWWARRRSSVFRSMLIAAATKAPDDPSEAAKLVWDNYYANHQNNEAFRKLKVADIFMGGGTTLVEGARLGMQMTGNDLNPVAWLVVKNELADVDLDEVNKLFDHIEREVKPQIMPFYACEGPNGEKGKWTQRSTGKVMGDDFDPLALMPEERKDYNYEGPEVIYTFWAKHGPCAAPGCGHRTPLMTSPVVAVKSLSVKSWEGIECQHCTKSFDIERHEARMAPDVPLVVSDSEAPYTIMDNTGNYQCPHCQHQYRDAVAAQNGESLNLPKRMSKNKKIDLTLLVHPDWLKGSSQTDEQGIFGGTSISEVGATQRWNLHRTNTLKLIEVRGKLPDEITCPDSGVLINTQQGTIPKKSTFTCQENTCGRQQDVLDSIRASGQTGPMAAYVLQCYSPRRNAMGAPYNGRYFAPADTNAAKRQNLAVSEWEKRKHSDLYGYWPESELPYGFMTHHLQGGVPNHGFTHWNTMFNPLQLLIHAQILKAIDTSYGFSDTSKEIVLGAFQQYLRNQNMFCFWNPQRDTPEPMFSNNNYHPKSTVIENSVFADLGRGNWSSCRANTLKGLEWCKQPWETVSNEMLSNMSDDIGKLVSGKSSKTMPNDPVLPGTLVTCGSSTELKQYADQSYDLVITDPPFGGLLHYAELADFFYVWLRLLLKDKYPEIYAGEYTPKTLEAVSNKARHPDDPDAFYKRLLTECWREANRLLKPGGILAFTFHHSEDEPWVDVLESLFDAGYYLEATYPIRSDETKGKGEFGSKTIEYDIIHVCRKRTEAPSKISWARLRRKILADVKQLQDLLEHHQTGGLPIADIQVIKRGKALEYFSRHYGQVYVEEGREFTVNEALVGINQILDDQSESESGGTPVVCEPNTRQFLRIFSRQASVERDQMQKFLRGSGIAPSTFVAFGWATETTRPKAFHWRSPLEFAQERMINKRNLSRDFDQAMLLVGACYPESGINTKKILNENFKPHPALGHLLDWLVHNGADGTMRTATITARQLYTRWEAEHQSVVQQQISLFDMEGEV
jgi:SAM-dependent methyltransferase